jgi:hypothetical protein
MNLKGKSLRKAMKTKDAIRLTNPEIPLITDTTELITVEKAQSLLKKNKNNRPINWNKVGEYSDLMSRGEWRFHSQGIILDSNENVLTGQKRLWAIIYSGIPQHMRISKGSPPETADFIDRGTSQSARDLASRKTERKHSPMEQSLARAILALHGNTKPSVDNIANCLSDKSDTLEMAIKNTRRIKKTKSRYMVMAAIAEQKDLSHDDKITAFGMIQELGDQFDLMLGSIESSKCWNRGAAFTLAMEKAEALVKKELIA